MQVLVFDSGVGGLSVVRELRALMPNLHIDYVADDAFRPYGEKTISQLKSRLPGLLRNLQSTLFPDIVVLACNTASTAALEEIRAKLDIPVVGVVPAIKPAALISRSKTIAVLGTPGTVKRKYVKDLITEFADGCDVKLHGSSELVHLAERKLQGEKISGQDIWREIAPIFAQAGKAQIDAVVLACTHFPLLKEELSSVASYPLNWIDSGAAIAKRTQFLLSSMNTRASKPAHPQTAFSIGGEVTPARKQMFQCFGFEKTVCL